MNLLPLTQAITYWVVSGRDGNNTPTWSPGVMVKARWVEQDGTVTDEKGEDQKTEFIAYTTANIPKRSMAITGDMDGVVTPPNGSRKVFNVVNNPSLTALKRYKF